MMRSDRLEELGLQLVTVSRNYRRRMDALFRDFGLTDASTLPLRYLVRQHTGIRQKDLAEALGLEGPTLARILDHLVELELVERTDHPDDGRAKLILATGKGRAFHATFTDPMREMREKLFDGITDAEIYTTLALLSKLDGNMQSLEAAEV